MELRHLVTFRAVLREGSFLAASRALGLAQPTVTLHIQELEAELGLELFDRHGRRRPTTPRGSSSPSARCRSSTPSTRCTGAWRSSGRAERLDPHRARSSPLRASAITPLLGKLRRERPALRVRMDVSGTQGVSRAVADGELDLGLCSAPPPSSDLDFEPLFAEEMALLVPRGHRLARARPLRAADLEGEPPADLRAGLRVSSRGRDGALPSTACARSGRSRAAAPRRCEPPSETGSGIAMLPRAGGRSRAAGHGRPRAGRPRRSRFPSGLIRRPDARRRRPRSRP